MSKTAKIILGIVVGLVVLGAAAVFAFVRFSGAFTLDEEQAAEIGQKIISHELPPAFTPEFGTDIFGLRTMIAISADESTIMLFEAPGSDEDNIRTQADGQFSDQMGTNLDFEYLGTQEVVLNGETVNLDTYVATDQGKRVIQEIGVFKAESGNVAVVMMIAPADTFDDYGFEAFLDSMR